MKTKTMKIKPSFLIGFASIIVAIIFLLWRGCESPKIDPIKKTVDSLIQSNDKKIVDLKTFRDSMSVEIGRRDSTIVALTIQREGARIDARKSAKNASYWAERYDSAKSATDTAGQLAACDSLRTEFGAFQEATDIFVKASDSVILSQFDQLEAKDRIIERQDSTILSQSQTIKQISAAFYDQEAKGRKLEKNVKKSRFWNKVKTVGLIAAGIALYGFSQ
jgi:hypothetical protein